MVIGELDAIDASNLQTGWPAYPLQLQQATFRTTAKAIEQSLIGVISARQACNNAHHTRHSIDDVSAKWVGVTGVLCPTGSPVSFVLRELPIPRAIRESPCDGCLHISGHWVTNGHDTCYSLLHRKSNYD
jgi:hypothetical protein